MQVAIFHKERIILHVGLARTQYMFLKINCNTFMK